MSNHQPVWEEWQKASLYGMLAGLYEYNDPDWGRYYRQLHSEALSRLAALVRQHGLPPSSHQTHGASAAASMPGLPGLEGPSAWPSAAPSSTASGYDGGPFGMPGYGHANPYAYPVPPGQHSGSGPAYQAPGTQWGVNEAAFPAHFPGFSPPAGMQGTPAFSEYPGSYGHSHPQPGSWPSPPALPPQWTGGAAYPKPARPPAGVASPQSAHDHSLGHSSLPHPDSQVLREPLMTGDVPLHPPADANGEPPDPAEQLPPACIRLLHARPDKQRLEFQLGTAVHHLDHLEASGYLEVQPGRHLLLIQEESSPLASAEIDLRSGARVTVAAAGEGDLFVFEDESESSHDRARIRLLHLAAGHAPADLMIRDGGTLFRRVEYGSSSPYVTLSPAELELELCEAGSLRMLLSPQAVQLSPAQAATLLFTGHGGLIQLSDES